MAEKKLVDQVRDVARLRHLSLRTEETYWNWIKRFILFHGKRHPRDLDAEAVRDFLTHLAVNERVAASTQNQAFNALLFLYRQVLKLEPPNIDGVERARQSRNFDYELRPVSDFLRRAGARLTSMFFASPGRCPGLLYFTLSA